MCLNDKNKEKRKKRLTKLLNILEYVSIFDGEMVSNREKRQIKHMYASIKKLGCCTARDIQDDCGNMSISTFNKLKPYLLEDYEGRMEYRRDRKMFVDLNPDEQMKEEIQKVMEQYQS